MSVEAGPELVEQEYLWTCSLSAACKEFVWKPEVGGLDVYHLLPNSALADRFSTFP